jgi:sugar lactone lactonase YvrE
MTRQLKAELLSDIGAVLGEGPSWDARTSELVSVDILSGTVYLHDYNGVRTATYDVGGHVGSALPAEEGGWLLVGANGFELLKRDGTVQPILAVEADRPELRFNDAKCDPWGHALAGTMRYDQAPGSATLYRLEATTSEPVGGAPVFSARILLRDLGLANGLGWNAVGDTLYFIDSLAGMVARYAYAPDMEQLGPSHQVVAIDASDGLPDGMCVDEAGNLWVALYGGGAVHCFRPDGQLDTVVSVPAPFTTSVAFGGPRGDRLFITTAAEDDRPAGSGAGSGSGSGVGPGAGGLWAVDPGIAGAPATPWVRS